MKNELPNNHGLSEAIIEHLVFKIEGMPSLTNVQYKAVEQGVGRGKSLLVLAFGTGK